MAIRDFIKTEIDTAISNGEFSDYKGTQRFITTTEPMNEDEIAYFKAQVAADRASNPDDIQVTIENASIAVDLDATEDSVEVLQDTHDDLNANANMQVGDADVANGNPVPVSDAGGTLTVDQATHDSLNANANVQQGDADVDATNKLHTQSTAADDFKVDANLQQGDADIDNTNKLHTQSDTADEFKVDANLQVGDADVDSGNPVDTSEANSADILTSLETLDDIIGTEDSSVPSKLAQVGGEARDTVATELDNGDLASFLFTLFKELIIAGYNRTTQSIDVTDINPAKMAFEYLIDEQLTAAGSTAEVNVELYDVHTVQFLIANIDDSVTVRVEGSLDGTNWFNVDNEADPEGVDTTYTDDGTYFIPVREKCPTKLKKLRATMVDEEGGTAVTVDVLSMHGC